MRIESHKVGVNLVAELISGNLIIKTIDDGIDLIGNMYYQDFNGIIVYEENIVPDFFDLKNRMAGEILQKFSNYRLRLIIVGDFSRFTKQSIKDFIYECNKGHQVNFVKSLPEALSCFSLS